MKYRNLLFIFLLSVFASCSKDPELGPDTPPSTFKVRIDNVIHETYFDGYPQGPSLFVPYLVMSGLPEGEKLLAFGGYYSPENPNPDGSDYTFIHDCADDELIQGWDWTQELIYSAGWIDLPIPGKTYYFKGVVRTNKAVYYSNTVTINTDGLPGYTPGPQDRVLPVVFHVMPRKDGTYPHPYFFDEMLACANRLYRNVWPLPGLADAGIRFVPATHAPDGTALSTPGIHYLDERYELDRDISYEELRQWVGDNLWEMTEVINVWVSPFINDHIVSEDTSTAGFTFLPYFAPEEMLQGCNTAVPGCFSGIFLNQEIVGNGYCNSGIAVFAHEAGHYLGLDHVFEEDWCDDTPQYDRARYRTEQYIPGIDTYLRYPIDASAEPYTALNVMDYDIVIYSGITPQQAERVRYTLQHACLVPGGKPLPGNMKSCAGPAPKVMY